MARTHPLPKGAKIGAGPHPAIGKMMVPDKLTISEIENALHRLNYRWKSDTLALWRGHRVSGAPDQIYAGYEEFISLKTIERIDALPDKKARIRLKFALIDHFLRRILMPHEAEMHSWTRSAAAQVDGHNIYFKDIIAWCQKSSTHSQRQVLQSETGALCKFLKPFALNYWSFLLEILRDHLGFENYLEYCRQKKEIDFTHYYHLLHQVLERTDSIYFAAMEHWSRRHYELPLADLTRFDAINLLGLGQFDALFPERSPTSLTEFFRCWEIDVDRTPGLTLELGQDAQKSSQAMCFILSAPGEVHVLMRPEGGWVDLETLWHELGHGLAAVHTSAELPRVDRDMTTSDSLSEAYAFLLQNLTLSRPFLRDYLGLAPETAQTLYYYKVLKDLSVFRRYAAKFIAEVNMFSSGNLADGRPYADVMARYTGFYHQPESHLFDLVAEFYCLDYLLGWMGEAVLENHLRRQLGEDWMFNPEAGVTLKKWWSIGNQYAMFDFFEKNGLAAPTPDLLLQRWEAVLD